MSLLFDVAAHYNESKVSYGGHGQAFRMAWWGVCVAIYSGISTWITFRSEITRSKHTIVCLPPFYYVHFLTLHWDEKTVGYGIYYYD